MYSVESHVVSDFRATAFPVSTPAESSEQPTASPWHCYRVLQWAADLTGMRTAVDVVTVELLTSDSLQVNNTLLLASWLSQYSIFHYFNILIIPISNLLPRELYYRPTARSSAYRYLIKTASFPQYYCQ